LDGAEVTDEAHANQSVIFEQAENRAHIIEATLVATVEGW
jgi:ornithine carbamoyltransferase